MLARLTSSDEPPLLTSGSGMPLVGSRPSTTLMFRNAWATTIVVMPSARKAPNRSGAVTAARRPRQAMTQKQTSDERGAEQAELLGDHREDEVGVRLGQVEELLDAAHQAAAEPAAAADGDERLQQVEAVAERIATPGSRTRVQRRRRYGADTSTR